MADQRPPLDGDERTLLLAFLQEQRDAVTRKCEGLPDDLAHRRLLADSSPVMSVAGVVAHLRWVEHSWFEHRLAGEPHRRPGAITGDFDDEFQVDDIPLTTLIAEYVRQCSLSNEIVASLDLDTLARLASPSAKGRPNARWILLHMIEETARHAGHLDIMREQLDGVTGD